MLGAGTNRFQLHIVTTSDGSDEQTGIAEWYATTSLPVGSEATPEQQDIIAGSIAQVTTAVDSLDAVKLACQTSETNSAASALDAGESASASETALSQLIGDIGTTVCPLGTDGKIPVGNLPALATTETDTVANTAAMIALTAQRGDFALIVPTDTVTDSYVLAGDDPTVLANWVKFGVGYVASAGHAVNADTSTNSLQINGSTLLALTQAAYNAAVIDPSTIYLVG
jgi:hypothetical protein